MNKLERRLKGLAKFKKRIKYAGYTEKVLANLKRRGVKVNLHVYKTTGTPCSCNHCNPEKYTEKAKYKNNKFNKHMLDEE